MDRNVSREDFASLSDVSYSSIAVGQFNFIFEGLRYDRIQNAGSFSQPHMHDFFEIQYLLEGEIHSSINGISRAYHAGQYYTITPYALHSHACPSFYASFTLRWKVERLRGEVFDPDLEAVKYTMDHAQAIAMDDTDDIIFQSVLGILDMNRKRKSRLDTILALVNLICRIADSYKTMGWAKIRPKSVSSPADSILSRSLTFIENHYMEPITASTVADAVPISYSHLERLFNQYMGATIKSYIRRVRLDKAIHLLMTTDEDVEDISLQAGFSSSSYFATVFRDTLGESPSKFRKHYRQNYFSRDVSIR